jgi:hypothetical protein
MGRVARIPLAAIGLLTPAPCSAATPAHRQFRMPSRRDSPARTVTRRRVVEGETTMEAMQANKRHLFDVVYKQLLRDANKPEPAGRVREDNRERLCNPARTAQSPTAAPSDESQPRPATGKRRTKLATTEATVALSSPTSPA